jgi:RNA polymerase sigma-70 factor (ECF subfamily)
MTDSQLVRRVRAGSEAALETLYRRHLPSVWRYVYAQVGGDVPAAEDVVSETFLAAVRGLRGLDPDGGSLCAWLTGIARHKLADHWRRAQRSARLASDPPRAGRSRLDATDPPNALAAAETRRQVGEAMVVLPDEHRAVLEWKYLDNLSVAQIAARMGRSEKAAEALLYRARRSFRAVFEARAGG